MFRDEVDAFVDDLFELDVGEFVATIGDALQAFDAAEVASDRVAAPSSAASAHIWTVCQGQKRSDKARQLQPFLVTNNKPSSTCREGSL